MDYKMAVTMMIAGLLSTMNIWTIRAEHVRFHLNDIYMIILMTGWSLLIGSVVHGHQSSHHILYYIIVIVATIYAIRNQTFINDAQFLNGMIPHHSMAILMAKKIKEKTTNPRIHSLAKNIIETQEREIREMKTLSQLTQ